MRHGIEVNNDLFRFGGAMNRVSFIVNTLKLIFLSLLLVIFTNHLGGIHEQKVEKDLKNSLLKAEMQYLENEEKFLEVKQLLIAQAQINKHPSNSGKIVLIFSIGMISIFFLSLSVQLRRIRDITGINSIINLVWLVVVYVTNLFGLIFLACWPGKIA